MICFLSPLEILSHFAFLLALYVLFFCNLNVWLLDFDNFKNTHWIYWCRCASQSRDWLRDGSVSIIITSGFESPHPISKNGIFHPALSIDHLRREYVITKAYERHMFVWTNLYRCSVVYINNSDQYDISNDT